MKPKTKKLLTALLRALELEPDELKRRQLAGIAEGLIYLRGKAATRYAKQELKKLTAHF